MSDDLCKFTTSGPRTIRCERCGREMDSRFGTKVLRRCHANPEIRPFRAGGRPTGCTGCKERKAALNEWMPGLGKAVETAAEVTGIKALVDGFADRRRQGRPVPPYLTLDHLTADTLSLIPRLPEDISVVVGVARSGMLPASILAMHLHLPLFALTTDGVVDCGHGWRLKSRSGKAPDPAAGTALIVDDTLMTGNSLKQARAITARHFDRRLHAHVYVNPEAKSRPDLFAAELFPPHVLEWNLFNSVHLSWAAFDFDGILCRDFTPDEDDDGPNYLAAMEAMRPRFLPRKEPIHIVTSRLKKYREPTQAWLDRWGIRAASLTMGPWDTIAERRTSDVAEWKAHQLHLLFRRMRPSRKFGGPLYVESDPRLAEKLARQTGYQVVCPTTKRCF